MKNEELNHLKAKYFAGETSLEEERRLKALEDDAFFSNLNKAEEKLDWSFESFLDQVESTPLLSENGNIRPLYQRLLPWITIAAVLILGFFLWRPTSHQSSNIADQLISEQAENPASEGLKPFDVITPSEQAKDVVTAHNKPVPVASNSELKQRVAQVKNNPKPKTMVAVENQELYVEVNGVRIYDEEKALEVTEAAIQLATNNLKTGMKSLEKVKHLHIEI